ncbi:hypothetical protein ABT366_34895, partial [Streptomyces lydicus]
MPPGAPGPEPLDELVARLTAAGLPPDARAMADALWLAQWITPDAPPGGPADAATGRTDRPDRTDPATFRVGPAGTADQARDGAPPASGSGPDAS